MALLAGIRVVDMSHQAAGPWCTTLLGDMGADVVKVEKPGRGDSMRHGDRSGRLPPAIGGFAFQGLNRNKRGVTADIGTPGGVAVVQRLARAADVFVENFRPGVMARHDLGWDVLHATNPRLVYCSISAFGATGPLAAKPGMDLVVQATAGIVGHTGEADGPPAKAAPPVADIVTGVYAAYAIAAALVERGRTGAGRHLGVAMLDAVLSLFADSTAAVLTEGRRLGKFGSGHPDVVPYQAFPAADGWFVLACLTNAFYKRLCVALGKEEWLTDPRFATNVARVEHREELVAALSERFRTRPSAHWIALLEAHDIPACHVNRLEEILAHPQVAANGLVVERDDPVRGRLRLVGPPIHVDGTPGAVARPAPALGEHTDAVLAEVGFSPGEIAALRAEHAI